jgi:hypothetical protein
MRKIKGGKSTEDVLIRSPEPPKEYPREKEISVEKQDGWAKVSKSRLSAIQASQVVLATHIDRINQLKSKILNNIATGKEIEEYWYHIGRMESASKTLSANIDGAVKNNFYSPEQSEEPVKHIIIMEYEGIDE